MSRNVSRVMLPSTCRAFSRTIWRATFREPFWRGPFQLRVFMRVSPNSAYILCRISLVGTPVPCNDLLWVGCTHDTEIWVCLLTAKQRLIKPGAQRLQARYPRRSVFFQRTEQNAIRMSQSCLEVIQMSKLYGWRCSEKDRFWCISAVPCTSDRMSQGF